MNTEELREFIQKTIKEFKVQKSEIKEVEIPDEYTDFDPFEFHSNAKDQAKSDIEGEGESFEEIGANDFEKDNTENDFADKVSQANLKLPSDEREVDSIKDSMKSKEDEENKLKSFGDKLGVPAFSLNEENREVIRNRELIGKISLNEDSFGVQNEDIEYDFDQINLYKFLKDAINQLIEQGIDYAQMAEILEKELLKNFDIIKK